MAHLVAIAGSLRQGSHNASLARAAAELSPPGTDVEVLSIRGIPLYDADVEAAEGIPEPVQRLKAQIKAAHALLFVTPEYNRSIPGVLKNAIDHASRPHGQSAWAGKPAGVLGASVSAIGTSMAQQHLRNILAYLDMPTMGQPEAFIQAKAGLFDANGNVGPDSKKFLQSWMDRYVAWVKWHAA